MNRIESSGFRFNERGVSRAPAKNQPTDTARAAMQRMELYCMAHPGSPTAMRQPRLLARGKVWIALLGPNLEEGIAGFGNTVEAALRGFDAQYVRGLRPPDVASDEKMKRRAGVEREAFSANSICRPVNPTRQ
jgi:hypothetical protein